MVQMKEFYCWFVSSRIVMPMSVEEYEKAQIYMVVKMQQQNTTSTEGVEVLENKPVEDPVFGKGHYTSKVYRFQSKVPTWITSFAPADALVLQEEAWNAYPKCKSVIKCPYFSKMLLTIDTVHVADNAQSENVHGLSKEQLASREVEVIDLASSVSDYWSYLVGSCDVDFSRFKSSRTGRGPLLNGWREERNFPVMTAYKLVTVDAPYWGFGRKLEQALISGERALFLESHRYCFAWIDDWYGLTRPQLRQLERQCFSPANEEYRESPSSNNKEVAVQLDRRCSLDNKDKFAHSPRLKTEEQKLYCQNA